MNMQAKPVARIPAQLHIGDLDLKIQETDLYQLLRGFGDIAKIRVLRGATSAYAFVAFKDPETANRVRKELNGFVFQGRHIHVSKITLQRDSPANIFIKNFQEKITARDLEDLFSKFGAVNSCKVCYDDTGKSLSYGFVQFDSLSDAEIAVNSMNGKIWHDQELVVQKFVPFSLRISSTPNSNLYIRGFPLSYSEQDIKNIFGKYGEVLSMALMSDKSRAYGFVCFANSEEAKRACDEKNNTQEGENTWYVTPHMSKIHRKKVLREQYLSQVEEWKKKNLYIRNLDKSIDETILRELCNEYGPIKSLKVCKMENIRYDSEGNCSRESISKEIAYVHFETEQAASLALAELQKKLIQGKKLYVAKWKPRDALRKLINLYKAQKTMKFVGTQGRGLYPPRAMPRAPMPGRGIIPFGNMPQMMNRGRMQRVNQPPQIFPPAPPMQIIEPKKPSVLKLEAAEQYTIRDLGEKLYHLVLKLANPKIVGKITGMLLEMDKIEVINLINDENRLQGRVREAVEVLRRAWATEPQNLALLSN